MKQKKNYKKGALATDWLITIIVLIFAFTIILIFYYNIWPSYRPIDRDVCKQSVVFRATLPNIVQTFIPLKCKTNKVCITSSAGFLGLGKGDCSDFVGEQGVTTVKIKSETEIEKLYADEIIDCWKMMGEGKVSLFYSAKERYGVGVVDPSCVICSRIAYDKTNLVNAKIDMNRVNVRDYMMSHKISGMNKTYFEYLAGEGGLYSVADKNLNILDVLDESTKKPIANGAGATITSQDIQQPASSNTNQNLFAEDAIFFMQLSEPTHTGAIEKTMQDAGMVWGASFFAAPVTTIRATVSGVKALANPYVLGTIAVLGIYQHGNIAYNKMLSAGYCGDVTSGSSAREGCSVVRTTNYNATQIAQYCGNIEGMP